MRPSDTLARLGGDEFGVLCPSVEGESEAVRLAERIVHTISDPFTIDKQLVHSSVSIGLAISNAPVLTATALVEQADEAMYGAKAAGRAQWATTTATRPRPPVSPGEVKDVLVRVVQAHGELTDLLGRVDPCDVEWNRLAQASHSLRQAIHLLEGNSRIG